MTRSSRYVDSATAPDLRRSPSDGVAMPLASAIAELGDHASQRPLVEEWRPTLEDPDNYQVSNWGRVRSVDRVLVDSRGQARRLRGKLLSLDTDQRGYQRVGLGRAAHNALVSVLVAEAFHGPRPDGAVLRHLDGIPDHNWPSNLRWGTQSENMYDRVDHGHHVNANKDCCPRHHLLEPPNLVASKLTKNLRECLACAQARSAVWRAEKHGWPCGSLQEEADYRYAKIMDGLPK